MSSPHTERFVQVFREAPIANQTVDTYLPSVLCFFSSEEVSDFDAF